MTYTNLKGRALFMVAIILSLPIYSSVAMAVLSNGYIYGQDNVKKYYRRGENTKINVTAWINGDNEITPQQIHLNDFRGPIFNSCTPKGSGSFDCTYPMPSGSITENPYQLRIALYKDGGIFDSLLILQGAYDEEAPEIKSFNVAPLIVNGGNVNFNYNVYDHSSSPTDTNKCSGIDRLELSNNAVVFETVTINSQSDQCSAVGTITVPISRVTNNTGVIDVILTAYDNFNQASSALTQFTYDTSAPVIDTASLEIKDSNGNLIDYVSNNPISNAVISFIVTAEDLNINNVFGDISEINTNAPSGYDDIRASCSSITSSEYLCSFSNVQIRLSSTTNVHITINAPDIAGNVNPTILTKNIGYDITGPTLTSIRTNKVDSGISFIGGPTTFIAELNEVGVGITSNNLRLDLSNIKTGLNSKLADNCTNSGNDWTCYWYDITTDKSDGEKTVSLSGTDRLNNAVVVVSSSTVTVDNTAPIVSTSTIAGVGTGIEAFAGHIKTGDTLDATLHIKEKNRIRAYADFSSFVTTQDNITGSCTKAGTDDWTCDFSTSTIDIPRHITSNVNFNIVDFVGNSVQHQKPVEVLWYEDAVNVSYWTSSVKCSPGLIDRQITNLVNIRAYCAVELLPITPDQEPLSISLGSCTDNFNNSLGFIENIELLNAGTGSTEPYLAVNLIKGEMNIDRLSIKCPLQIISRVGAKINQNPEIEFVDINLGFYNMPLGEYGTGIEDKIEDAKDEAFGTIWEIVGFLDKIFKWGKLICNALLTIQKVKLIWGHVTTSLTSTHLAMIGTPVEPILARTKSGACAIDETIGNEAGKYFGFFDKICKFINCQLSPSPPDSEVHKRDSKSTGAFGGIGDAFKGIQSSLESWNYKGNELLGKAPGGGAAASIFSAGQAGSFSGKGTIEDYFGKQPYQYMNARDNLLVALVTGCIPGMINGLNKYRQILCLYADCLEQNAQNNVPVKACEDQKSYATCKYIFGEIFAVLPWTALFDYYTGMIRSALSDPLSAIGVVISFACQPNCVSTADGSIEWMYTNLPCRLIAFTSMIGEVIGDVYGIIDDYKQIKGDYCERLDDDDDDD